MVQSHTSRRKFIQTTGGAAVLAGVAGCLGDDGAGTGDDTDDDALTIGAIYPLSGDLAELGEESLRGAELAFNERNEDGGVDGQEVELEVADAPDADAGVSGVVSLVDTHDVPIILGSYSSTISRAASQRAAQDDVAYWELGAVADVITDDNPGNTFRTNPTASFFGEDGVELAANVIAPALDIEVEDLRMAVMYESGEYGNAVGDGAISVAEEVGIEVVEDIEYEADTSDLSSEIQRLDSADVDVLNHTGYDPDIDLLWNQLENLDVYIPTVIGNGAGYSLQTFTDNVGDTATLGTFNVDFTNYNTNPEYAPGIAEFVDLYTEEYGDVPLSGHSLANYFGANVLLDTLEAADSTGLEDVREAALSLDEEEQTSATSWGVSFDEDTLQNERISVIGHQWQENVHEDDIWRPDVTDGSPDLYSLFPEEARLEMIDVDYIPQPDYTQD